MKSSRERLGPEAELALDRGPLRNVYYPNAQATLSVIFETFDEPDTPRAIDVVPKAMTINSNSYKEADTWQLTFDANDLPVSPELIRTGSAELYLYRTRGIAQRPTVLRAPGGEEPVEAGFLGLEPSIVGLFDEVETTFGDDGRWVTITGQDYTSLFIAKQWPVKKRLPSGKRLDEVIAELKGEVESAEKMSLVVDPPDLSLPVVGSESSRTNKKGEPVREVDNYWEAMYRICLRNGFILFVRNLELVITTPQALMGERPSPRKMTWGRNLSSLRMRRRMAKETVPVVECRSYDDATRTVVRGRFPPKGNPQQVPVTGLGTKKEEVRLYTIPGIRSTKRLAAIAKTTYNLISRAEQLVEIETRDLEDSEGASLLGLRTGDALAIGFDERYGAGLMESQSVEQRRETLVGLGYDVGIAQVIAQRFEQVNVFRRPFRVREATFDWSSDDGLTVRAELQNFVNVKGREP